MENLQLYFIAVIPPPELCEAVIVFKRDMQERFGSKAAMKVIPHITLKSPFKLSKEQEPDLRNWFRQIQLPGSPFPVRLNGFGAFPKAHSPVIFIKPELSPELLGLQQRVINAFREYLPQLPIHDTELNFHPHITIAYRDLSQEMFQRVWPEYEHKKFEEAFFADQLHLLHHDGKQWTVIETVDFQ